MTISATFEADTINVLNDIAIFLDIAQHLHSMSPTFVAADKLESLRPEARRILDTLTVCSQQLLAASFRPSKYLAGTVAEIHSKCLPKVNEAIESAMALTRSEVETAEEMGPRTKGNVYRLKVLQPLQFIQKKWSSPSH